MSRDVVVGGGKDARTVTVALDGFSVLNRVNYGRFIGTVGSPLFGQPVSAGAPANCSSPRGSPFSGPDSSAA